MIKKIQKYSSKYLNSTIYKLYGQKFELNKEKSNYISKNSQKYDEFNPSDSLPTSKSNFKYKEISLPRDIKQLMLKSNLPLNFHSVYKVFNNLNKFISTHFIVGDIKLQVLISCLFYYTYLKRDVYLIVDDDELAFRILEIVNSSINVPAVYIKDNSKIKLMKIFKQPTVTLINYENISDEWVDLMRSPSENYIFFFKIKDTNNKLKEFVKNPKINNLLNKSATYSISQNMNEFHLFNDKLKNSVNKYFFTHNFSKEEQNEMCEMSIRNFGMNVTQHDIIHVTFESAKKFLRQNKKILILCKDDDIKKEIENKFFCFENDLINEELRNNLQIKSLNEVLDYLNSESDFELKIFDVLIESTFSDINNLILIKRKFFDNKTWSENIMITLFKVNEMQRVSEMRQQDLINFKFINLLSPSFLINDKSEIVENKFPEIQNLIENEIETEFWNKINNFYDLHKNKETIKYFDNYYSTLKNNPNLAKNILKLLFKNKFEDLYETEREDSSLITGEYGYYTCYVFTSSIKQIEERYYITKFLLRNGLVNIVEYEKKVFRIYNSFKYVVDIPLDKFKEIQRKAKEEKINIEICYDLPIIFYHQYSEMLKNKN